jgi:hypothetical protein
MPTDCIAELKALIRVLSDHNRSLRFQVQALQTALNLESAARAKAQTQLGTLMVDNQTLREWQARAAVVMRDELNGNYADVSMNRLLEEFGETA